MNVSNFFDEIFLDDIMEFPFEKFSNSNVTSEQSSYPHLVVRTLSVYSLVLVIMGTLGNLLTVIILCRRNLRRHVTMRYLIAVSVCDTISLYGWNLNNFYKFTVSPNNINIEQLSLVHCRLISFMSFVGLQLSSWYLTAVSIGEIFIWFRTKKQKNACVLSCYFILDRCLSLHYLTWKKGYGKASHAKYHITTLTLVCLILNSHILFFNGYRTNDSPSTVKCYVTKSNPHYIFPQWERVHLVVYNLCPFSIMCICNAYIIYKTIHSARIRLPSSTHVSRNRQISLTLILVTCVFVVLTLPSCIYYVFFRHRMSSERYPKIYRYMIQICLGSVQFTSHAINFFLYCFFTRNFRHELNNFLQEICLFKSSISTGIYRHATIQTSQPTSATRKQCHDQRSIDRKQQSSFEKPTVDVQVALMSWPDEAALK